MWEAVPFCPAGKICRSVPLQKQGPRLPAENTAYIRDRSLVSDQAADACSEPFVP